MGRLKLRCRRAKKIGPNRRTPVVTTEYKRTDEERDEVISAEAQKLYEELKRQRDAEAQVLASDDSEFEWFGNVADEERSVGSVLLGISMSPEPMSTPEGERASSDEFPDGEEKVKRRRQWRRPPRTESSCSSIDVVGTPKEYRNLTRCTNSPKNLSKDAARLKELSDHFLSVRSHVFMSMRYSRAIQLLWVRYFYATIPGLTVEGAMNISDLFMRWMCSQPHIVVELARLLCTCKTPTDSCVFDGPIFSEGEDEDSSDGISPLPN